MPARHTSTPNATVRSTASMKASATASSSSATRSQSNAKQLRPASSSVGVTTDHYEVDSAAGPSRLANVGAPPAARQRPLSKQPHNIPRSKIPVAPKKTLPSQTDIKGKGREVEPEPSRRSPVRSATKQHYALNESASSEEDEDMFIAPKSTRTPLASASDAPVQTPRNSQSASIKSRVSSSSALRNSGRGRTASVAPSEGWSAMKPIPMKTVFLSSPPRPGRFSETESSSDSDDEVRLIEDPTTSARKRKAAAGEYTWDERSRSCIPKRERSRSRSMTASAHRERYGESGTSGIADSSPASDRSHLQERIFPTSENDMLKNLLTNRLHARAMLGQSTPAKQEVHDAGHDPFLEEMEGASPILNAEPDPDIMLNLPEMPEPDFSGEHQPIFDFSQSALADEDPDDDFFSRQTGMSSSDDGFERSIIHLDGPQGWQGEAEEQELLPEFDIDDRSTVKDEELDDDVSMATAVDTADKTEIAIEQPVDPMRVSEELREPIIQQDASAPLGTLSAPSGKESQIQSMSEIAGIEQTVENLESNDDIPVPSIRSSSVTSELPPSSPPPLPSYPIGVTTSDFVDDQDGHALKDSPLTPSQAGPLSPKATNRLMPKQDNRYLATPKTAATASPALKHLLSTQKSRRSLKHTVYEVPVSDTPDVPVPRYDEKLFTDRARSPSPSVSGVTEAPLRSPPPGLRQFTPKGLSTYTTDQLFSRAKSPQLPQMTPVRLKSISPAPVALYTMVETHATPPDYQSTTVGSAVDRPKAEVAQAEVQQCVQEAIATLPAQTDVMDGAASPAMSPRPVSTLAFPPLSSITRPATRSPSPLRGPSPVKPPSNFEAQLPATPGPAARLAPYSATARPSSLLVPPSPFLGPISRGSRSPSPNAEAEQATLSLLSRVRALRSPSVPARPTSSHGRRLSPAAVVAVIDQSRIDTTAGASDQKKIQGVADLDEVQGEQNDLEPAEEEEVVPADELATNSDPAPVLGPVADMKEAPNESIRDVAPTPIDSNGPIASSEDISDTGLTDTKSDTDSEAEDAEVEHSLSQPRTPSKSPAAVRKLLPVDDPVMSPNVTVRRDRSASRSTASTRSTRSARTAANRPSSASRKLSFSDIAALDSSPISVAASIGRRSFDALDSSSEDELDEDEDKRASLGRPSPAKEIAAQQLRYEAMEEDELSSSEDEDLNLSSSPTRSNAGSLAKETTPGAMGITTTSTPARLMHSMALDTSEDAHGRHIAVSTPNPKRQSMQDPAPAPSPTQASHAILEQETTPPAQVSITSGTSRDAVDEIATLQEAKIESSQDSSAPEEDEIASENSRDSMDTSAILDEARPRTPLVVPPLASTGRPISARAARASAYRAAHVLSLQKPAVARTSIPPASDSEEVHSRQTRSQSVVSRTESVTSQASTMVQVSSTDPMAAARAAAILKVHHRYIQEGTWPLGANPLARAASGSSEEGERALDDLLKQAEREVSEALQEPPSALAAHMEMVQEHSSVEVGSMSHDHAEDRRERSMSASRHFVDQSRLDVWTRQEWRALEQCFIDELRRKRNSREHVEPAEVVRLYLESEQLKPEQCFGEWDPEKLEIRVEALIARKREKANTRASRERSNSIVSSAYSRAPSDFFANEDAHHNTSQGNESIGETSYLQIPGALLVPGRRRYARSAEPTPVEKPTNQQDYARHRSVSKYQSLQRSRPLSKPLSRETSLSSVAEAEETQSVASEPPPSSITRGVGRLYPSLEDLKNEMKPKKLLPVRGRSVAAAVNMFERIEEEQSMEAQWEQAWLKRKASEHDLQSLGGSGKRVHI